MRAAPGAPNSQVWPGAKIPPKDSPKIQTTRLQRDAGQAGQLRQSPLGRGEQPDADPDLDPDRRGRRLQRVIRPVRARPVDDRLHPVRGSGRRRLDDLGRQAESHLRLGLQDAVEYPDQPEPDPQYLPGRRLGVLGWLWRLQRSARLGWSAESAERLSAREPGAGGNPDDAQGREQQYRDQALMQQRPAEGGNHLGVVDVEPRVHPGHDYPRSFVPAGVGCCRSLLRPSVRIAS